MKKSEQHKKWKENEERAKCMTVKFIAALKKVDCYSSWASLLLEGIVLQKIEDKESEDDIVDTLEYTFGFRMFKSDSIATDMRIDEFLDTLKENPYQLKLIA